MRKYIRFYLYQYDIVQSLYDTYKASMLLIYEDCTYRNTCKTMGTIFHIASDEDEKKFHKYPLFKISNSLI